ncbi:type II toxin-antitoxin system VapC family toxin [Acidobacteria bacterium AH-259-A15]|nr:type II toxin-antitoxin system VapC family toxin [Acidobacteria bacterium AH-259-A15]
MEEPGRDRVLTLFASADEVVVSVLCLLECRSALRRLFSGRHLTELNSQEIWEAIQADVKDVEVVELDAAILRSGLQLIDRPGLRTLDALQLACALRGRCDLFVTADQRQAQAAENSGLVVEVV